MRARPGRNAEGVERIGEREREHPPPEMTGMAGCGGGFVPRRRLCVGLELRFEKAQIDGNISYHA